MKKNEIQLLLVVIGILVGFCSWQFIYKEYVAKTEVVEAENVAIKERLDKLEILNARQPEYLAEIERMKTEDDEIINSFPPGFRNEDIIMYLYNMELIDDNEVAISTIGMDAESTVPYSGVLEVDGYGLVDEGISMTTNSNTMTFTTTYNGLKNIISYIYGISTRKSVSAVNLVATEDGFLTGTLQLSFYALNGTEYPYVETHILGVPTGTENFFGVRNGTRSNIASEGEEGEEGEDGEDAEGTENAEDNNTAAQ